MIKFNKTSGILAFLLSCSIFLNLKQMFHSRDSIYTEGIALHTYEDFVKEFGKPVHEILTPAYFDSEDSERTQFFSTKSGFDGYRKVEFSGNLNHYVFKKNGSLFGWFPDKRNEYFVYKMDDEISKKFNAKN